MGFTPHYTPCVGFISINKSEKPYHTIVNKGDTDIMLKTCYVTILMFVNGGVAL